MEPVQFYNMPYAITPPLYYRWRGNSIIVKLDWPLWSNQDYCLLIHQGTKSWARIGLGPHLRKIEFVTFLFFPQQEWKTCWEIECPKLRFPTCELSKTHSGSVYLFHFRFQPHDPSFFYGQLLFLVSGSRFYWSCYLEEQSDQGLRCLP